MAHKKWGFYTAIYLLSIGFSFFFGKMSSQSDVDIKSAIPTSHKTLEDTELYAEPTEAGQTDAKQLKPFPTSQNNSGDTTESINRAEDIPQDLQLDEYQLAYEACERMVHAREQARQISDFIQRAQQDNSSARDLADDQFEQETVNYQWASDREEAIYASIENADVLDGALPLSVSCRSKNCRVVVTYDNALQAQKLSSGFREALATEDQSLSWLLDDSVGELVFYLGENSSLFQ